MGIVETRLGRIEGIDGDEICVFKGIPYAAAPVGERRWLAPEAHEGWSGVRAATEYSHASCQNEVELATLPILAIDQPTSEDCLYLNVFTPALDDAARPVMVWIHGGGFTIGAGTQMIGDDMSLATRGDVVVVTINYRLGALGFLNLNEVTKGAIPSTGNEGLLDQVAALEWVRDNIAAFGGDPGNVTIFGESAGGMSVGSLLGMPRAVGLFHKAIPQSGAASTANSFDTAVYVGEQMLELFGTRDPGALRALSSTQVLDAQQRLLPAPIPDVSRDPRLGTMPLQPAIDGSVIPRVPLESVAQGAAAGVPILVGSTLHEWRLFTLADPNSATMDEAALVEQLSDLADPGKLIGDYRAARAKRGDDVKPVDLLNAIETDRVFRMPGIRLAETQRAHESRVYNYLVSWESPFFGGLLGACHAIELGPLFGLAKADSPAGAFFGSGPDADRLSGQMQDAWTAFARTGDPTSDELAWPAYESDQRATMILGANSAVEAAPYDDERRAWDSQSDGVLGSL
ncbi:MAG: carboxylesterase/lipase family protein [Myxococcota bacterium]